MMKRIQVFLSVIILSVNVFSLPCVLADEIQEQANIDRGDRAEIDGIDEPATIAEADDVLTTGSELAVQSMVSSYHGEDAEQFKDQSYWFVVNYDNTTATIVGHDTTDNNLNIPATVASTNGTFTVTAIEDYAFNGQEITGAFSLPDTLECIGEGAFSSCSNITGELIIPDSVRYIGTDAFSYCRNLSGRLKLPTNKDLYVLNNGIFSGCSRLTGELIIPDTIHSIGEDTFSGCSGFTGDLYIPNNVYQIGSYAFEGCTGFSKLTIEDVNTIHTYYSTLTIGDRAFMNCTGFAGELSLPFRASKIGDYAFANCTGFTGLNLVYTIVENSRRHGRPKSIGKYAFEYCTGFTGDLDLYYQFTKIGDRAFYMCSGFDGELKLRNVTDMGREVFRYCSGFKKVTNYSSWKLDLRELNQNITWVNQQTGKEITELFSGTAIWKSLWDSNNEIVLFKNYSIYRKPSRTIMVGSDEYTIRQRG